MGWGLPRWRRGKEPACQRRGCRRLRVQFLGRKIAGVGTVNPLKYSGLQNSMDLGAWRTTVHGIAKRRIRLSTRAGRSLQGIGAR